MADNPRTTTQLRQHQLEPDAACAPDTTVAAAMMALHFISTNILHMKPYIK
jgi:hypothetical protein